MDQKKKDAFINAGTPPADPRTMPAPESIVPCG